MVKKMHRKSEVNFRICSKPESFPAFSLDIAQFGKFLVNFRLFWISFYFLELIGRIVEYNGVHEKIFPFGSLCFTCSKFAK